MITDNHRIIHIHDVEDPAVAAYTSIRERDLVRGHGGRFIVEGKVALRALLDASRFAIESVFLAARHRDLLASHLAAIPTEVPIYVASQSIMDRVVGFPIHRGVLACGIKGKRGSLKDLLGIQPSLLLGLCGLSRV